MSTESTAENVLSNTNKLSYPKGGYFVTAKTSEKNMGLKAAINILLIGSLIAIIRTDCKTAININSLMPREIITQFIIIAVNMNFDRVEAL